MPSQLVLRPDCPLSCPSETGTEKETATETGIRTRSETGNGTEEWAECGTCGRSGRERCSAGSEPVANGNGTGIRSGNLQHQEKKDGDPDPETESGGGRRGPRARKGRRIRRVMYTLIMLYRENPKQSMLME